MTQTPEPPVTDAPAIDLPRAPYEPAPGSVPNDVPDDDRPPVGVSAADAAEEVFVEPPPAGLWQKMKADPEYAPEHLALEAVDRLGPAAIVAVERLRAQYPAAQPDGLAWMVTRRFVNHARLSGAVSGATGLPGAVVDVGVLAWTQARMVLQIAAIYGADPSDPQRAAELLVLQGVHKYADGARTALGVAAGRERLSAVLSGTGAPMAKVLLRLGLKLAQMAGVRAGKKIVAKIIPGAAVVLGSMANAGATKSLSRRAIDLYRNHRRSLTAG